MAGATCLLPRPSQDWVLLKDALEGGKAHVEDNAATLMVRSYLTLQEGDTQSSEARTSQATLAALQRWWQLPDVGAAPQVRGWGFLHCESGVVRRHSACGHHTSALHILSVAAAWQ